MFSSETFFNVEYQVFDIEHSMSNIRHSISFYTTSFVNVYDIVYDIIHCVMSPTSHTMSYTICTMSYDLHFNIFHVVLRDTGVTAHHSFICKQSFLYCMASYATFFTTTSHTMPNTIHILSYTISNIRCCMSWFKIYGQISRAIWPYRHAIGIGYDIVSHVLFSTL